MQDKLQVHDEIEIKTAHHMGMQKGNRTMVAKPKNIDDKKKLCKHASNWKEKCNQKGRMYFLLDQQPEELTEERREIRDILMENRQVPPQTKLEMRVAKNKLMVNNQMYKKLITPPQVADISRLHVDEIEVA